VLAASRRPREGTGTIYRANTVTGKMVPWKTFGESLPAGAVGVGASYFWGAGGAYAYLYVQTLSQVYVVRGMK
jgi:hypothetical protein